MLLMGVVDKFPPHSFPLKDEERENFSSIFRSIEALDLYRCFTESAWNQNFWIWGILYFSIIILEW